MLKSAITGVLGVFLGCYAYCQPDTGATHEHLYRGIQKQIIKQYQEALTEYDSAIVVNPSYSRPYFNRGLVKYYLHDLKGSVEDYSKFIESNPKSSSAFDNRGYSKYLLGDNDGALSDYNSSIGLNPHVARAYLNRGGVNSISNMTIARHGPDEMLLQSKLIGLRLTIHVQSPERA